METMKVKTILEWETPKNCKDVQKFNRFCNFYLWYVQGYLKVAHSITHLMGNAPFEWGPKEQAAFNELKCLITSEEVTTQPCPIGKFHLEVNTLGYALGGVLSQLQDDKWCSATFISHTMTEAELNYDIYDKELLAIMYALKENGTLTSLTPTKHLKSRQITKTCPTLGKCRILTADRHAGT